MSVPAAGRCGPLLCGCFSLQPCAVDFEFEFERINWWTTLVRADLPTTHYLRWCRVAFFYRMVARQRCTVVRLVGGQCVFSPKSMVLLFVDCGAITCRWPVRLRQPVHRATVASVLSDAGACSPRCRWVHASAWCSHAAHRFVRCLIPCFCRPGARGWLDGDTQGSPQAPPPL